MNKLFSTILSAVLLMGGLCQSSCSDNDDIKLTGIDGRPSVLLSNGLVTASFIYSATSLPGSNIRMGKRLISVMRKGNYRHILHASQDMADGHAGTF